MARCVELIVKERKCEDQEQFTPPFKYNILKEDSNEHNTSVCPKEPNLPQT